jgi:hypothetical protein
MDGTIEGICIAEADKVAEGSLARFVFSQRFPAESWDRIDGSDR